MMQIQLFNEFRRAGFTMTFLSGGGVLLAHSEPFQFVAPGGVVMAAYNETTEQWLMLLSPWVPEQVYPQVLVDDPCYISLISKQEAYQILGDFDGAMADDDDMWEPPDHPEDADSHDDTDINDIIDNAMDQIKGKH